MASGDIPTQHPADGPRKPQPTLPPTPPAPSAPATGTTQIGPYHLTEILGEGGMGTFYRAEQTSPIKRTVALKLIKLGYGSREVIARFEAERQALARLDHPNIAKVLDAGTTENGQPFFVMEYVPGQPMTDFCDEHKLTIRQRLDLFTQVCDAIAHAHGKALIHRDIKPSNVLAYMADGKATVKVIDFGIAKALGNDEQLSVTLATAQGIAIGTPYYMSPEQAAGTLDIDTRTDVYSLGVLLYELLTGRKPFTEEDFASAAYSEILRIIREVEPPKPSVAAMQLGQTMPGLAEDRGTRLGTLTKALRNELEWIPLKAMRKDRTSRYASPLLLAEDVRNYLEGKPLAAGPESRFYRLSKFTRRNRAAVITAAVMALLLTSGVAFYIQSIRTEQRKTAIALADASQQKSEAEKQRDDARRATARAQTIKDLITTSLVSSDPNKAGKQSMLVTEAMAQAVARLDAGELKDQPEDKAELQDVIAGIQYGNANSTEGLRLISLSLETRQRLFKGDHPAVASSLNNVAVCLDNLGRRGEALPKYEAAQEMRQRLFKGDHTSVANSLNNVAFCLVGLGRSGEALPKYEAALEMRQRLFKGDHPAVAQSLNNVATCLNRLGRSGEALPKYEAALEMYQRLFKGDHPDVALSLNNVAFCLNSLGRSGEALPKLEATLSMYQRLFKRDHPEVALSLNSVAACLDNLGRSAEALPKYEAASEMYQRLFKGDHPDVARSLNNVAFCLDHLGRSAEALPKYEAALEMRRKVLPTGHRDTMDSVGNLALCQKGLHHAAEAEPLYRESLAFSEKTLGATAAGTCRVAFYLGEVLDELNRHEEAEGIRKKYRLGDPATRPATQATTRPATRP